jgi:hypothetical protein
MKSKYKEALKIKENPLSIMDHPAIKAAVERATKDAITKAL